jgi:hypothetical protein
MSIGEFIFSASVCALIAQFVAVAHRGHCVGSDVAVAGLVGATMGCVGALCWDEPAFRQIRRLVFA